MGTYDRLDADAHDAYRQPDDAHARGSNALRAALQAQLRARTRIADEDLRRLARVIAEAHRRSLRAEQVVVMLKQTWLSLRDTEECTGRNAADLMDRLIGICIEEYYEVRGGP